MIERTNPAPGTAPQPPPPPESAVPVAAGVWPGWFGPLIWVGLGLSVGGFAVGSIAIGGAAIGFVYAMGGSATAPAVIDATRCDQAVVDFARRWFATALPGCR